jgi:hypothetical protein
MKGSYFHHHVKRGSAASPSSRREMTRGIETLQKK